MASLFASVLFVLCCCSCAVGQPSVWPMPQQYTAAVDWVNVSSSFSFQLSSSSVQPSSNILQLAFERYARIIFAHQSAPVSDGLQVLYVTLQSSNETLQQGVDESYSLVVSPPEAKLVAATVYGVLRGLETFSQLVLFNFDTQTYNVPSSANVVDAPRFAYRGLLLDTSRHYQPLNNIRRLIEAMSYAKFNVFHWHAVDAQSFPIQSQVWPLLWHGAYSPQERYSQADIQDLVEFARLRGVRVMLELDGPGHAYAWGIGYPQLLPAGFQNASGCENQCPPKFGNPCDVPLDPSNNFTYQLLDALYGELSGSTPGGGLFPENFFHLGGDEVETGCWSNSPQIAAWMAAMNFTTYDQAYMYFVQNAHALAIAHNRIPVAWEEVFNHFGTQLDKRTVIHIWLDHATLAKVVAAGYRGILSDQDVWYLDHLDTTFQQMYTNDPFLNITDPTQQALVLGGETCMWGETVDASDMDNTVWPRAAAVAERLWSAASVSDPEAAMPRYQQFRCLLDSRGIGAAPTSVNGRDAPTGPGSCYTQ